ncbi:hypothetical protein [Rhizobium leguminosarum]|uniref:hypothetical protein n=1 Tax=Rhizobium leguminosarum TaxID=384 RepID=UPI0003A5574D|nr:hypothetical protein [Rhizobium leguminosarum]
MEFPLSTKSLEESNNFLRALWAEIRREFGKVGWIYTPRRNGRQNTIHFGFMSLGDDIPGSIDVWVKYGKRDSLKGMHFEIPDKTRSHVGNIEERLASCVSRAKNSEAALSQISMSVGIRANPKLTIAHYTAPNLEIIPCHSGFNMLKFSILAHDSVDADVIANQRLPKILDFLSVWTNCSFEFCSLSNVEERLDSKMNQFWRKSKWLEDFPTHEKYLRLEARTVSSLSEIIEGRITADSRVLQSALHFHQAAKFHRSEDAIHGDLITTLLISSLEAASLDLGGGGSSSCQTCGQPVYKISKRVAQLGRTHLGEYVEAFLKDKYGLRSKFLHAGKLSTVHPTTRNSLPLLDPSSSSGCVLPHAFSHAHNLLEYSGFILRALWRGTN